MKNRRKQIEIAGGAVLASVLSGSDIGAAEEPSKLEKIELRPTLVSFGGVRYDWKDYSLNSGLHVTKVKVPADNGDFQAGLEGNNNYDKVGFGLRAPICKELDVRGGFNYDGLVKAVADDFAERWAGYGGLQLRPLTGLKFTGLGGVSKRKPLALAAVGIETKSDGIKLGFSAGYLRKDDSDTYQAGTWIFVENVFEEKDIVIGVAGTDSEGKRSVRWVGYLGKKEGSALRLTGKYDFETGDNEAELIWATKARKGAFDRKAATDFIEDPIDNQPIRSPVRAIDYTNPPLNIRAQGSDGIEFAASGKYSVTGRKRNIFGEVLVYPIRELFSGFSAAYGLDNYSARVSGILGVDLSVGKYVNFILRGEGGASIVSDGRDSRKVSPFAGVLGRLQANF